MTVLFYRYGSICESYIIDAFNKLNINVVEETSEMDNKSLSPSDCIEIIRRSIETNRPVFVFSINFFPVIAEVCNIYKVLYLCWTVDSPVLELFSKSITHKTNRIFMFDKAQYDYFHGFNPNYIYHLPLASATEHFEKVINSITETDINKYQHDITFVGSLYTEKNPLRNLQNLPEYMNGYIKGLVEAKLKVYGYNFIEETLEEDIINAIQSADSSFFSLPDMVTNPARYIVAHEYVGMQVAETERIKTLNKLAKHFNVSLYTRSDCSMLENVHIYNGISTLTEMPKAFHLSKINLNMTIPPIQTGLPLRIFDILGCGGFLITNYQQELSEYFEIGVDLETYTSLDELIDKCAYYLNHDDERKQIAINGYRKVQTYHTYEKRIIDIFRYTSI